MNMMSPAQIAAASVPPGVTNTPVTSIRDWLFMRQRDVTASTIAALLGDGVHDYMSAYELWAEKSDRRPATKQTPTMRRGQLMEPVILQMLREDFPEWRFEQANRYYSHPSSRIGATPDFFAIRPDRHGFGVIDAKSVGKYAFRKGWRDADGDVSVPLWIAIQITVTAALCGASWGAVAPLQMGDGGLDLSFEEIPLRPAVMPRLHVAVDDFWRRVKQNDPYPPNWGRDAALVAALYEGEGGPVIDLGADAEVVAWLNQRESLKLAEAGGAAAAKERKLIDAKLIYRLGNASGGRLSDGRSFAVKVIRKKAYSVAPTQYPQLTVEGSAPAADAGPF